MIEKSIHEQIALRKLNILKGFKDITESPLKSLKQLQKEVDCPIYSEEVVKGYINEVNTTIKDVDERAKIQEHLNTLEAVTVVNDLGFRQTVYLDKGHMDFDGSSSGGGGRQGLVKKQITDKMGRKTSRWVRGTEDEKGKDSQPQPDEEDAKNPTDKKEQKQVEQQDDINPGNDEQQNADRQEYQQYMADYAKQTDSETLKKYIQNNPDNDAAEYARKELEARGESMDDTEEPMDYDNPDSVKFALDAHPDKDAIIDFAITHGVPIGQAMKLHDATKQDHSETHAAIDEAQNSLNALKEKTGHPEMKNDNVGEGGQESSTANVSEELHDKLFQMIGDISANNSKNKKLKQEVIDEVYDSMSGDSVDYDKVISIIEDYAANDRGATIKQESIENLIDEYYAEMSDQEQDDFINPGNTKDQAKDREQFTADKKEGGEDKSGESDKEDKRQKFVQMDDNDVLEDLADKIFNAQGKDYATDIFDAYMELKDRGLSDQDIEDRMAPGAWDFPHMSDEERQGMKEDWESALDGILGEDREKK